MNILQTVKHGGEHVVVRGCISASGVSELVVIERIMNTEKYIDILRHNLNKSARKLRIEETSFQ